MLGLALLAVPSGTLILFFLFSLLGFSASPAPILIAALIACSTLFVGLRKIQISNLKSFSIVLAFSGVLFGLTLCCASVFDNTWDGLTYHQTFITGIHDGWNPIYGMRDRQLEYFIPWRMTKGYESITACWYAAAQGIEGAKAVNFVALLAAMMMSWRAFLEAYGDKRNSMPLTFLFAAVAALNPVALTQAFSFYLDGMVSNIFLCSLSSLALILLRPSMRSAWLGLALSTVLLPSLKLTGVILVAVTFAVGAFAMHQLHKDKILFRRFSSFSLALLITSTLVIGANPYLLNIYMLLKSPKAVLQEHRACLDMLNSCGPIEFVTHTSQLQRFALSLFCRTNNSQHSVDLLANNDAAMMQRQHPNLHLWNPQRVPIELALPFSVNQSELTIFSQPDVRIGGFGPWFGEIVILSMAVFAAWLATQRPLIFSTTMGKSEVVALQTFLYLCFIVLATTSLVNANWWARYVPQFWLFPVFLLFTTLTCTTSAQRMLIPLCSFLCLTALVNSCLTGFPNWCSNFDNSRVFRAELNAARLDYERTSSPVAIYSRVVPLQPSICTRLKEHGIPYLTTNTKPNAEDRCYRILDNIGIVFGPSRRTNSPETAQ